MPSDITICGHIYYDIIYLLTKFPKEKDDIRNPIVKKCNVNSWKRSYWQ